MVSQLSHGGRTEELAREAGIPEGDLLDFSANLNPLGQPPWLGEAIAEGRDRIGVYPDPDSRKACQGAARRYGLAEEGFVFADGADSLIMALPQALGASSCVLPLPSYSGYRRSAIRAGLPTIAVPLGRDEEFSLSAPSFARALDAVLAKAPSPSLVFLGSPNNPVGGGVDPRVLGDLAHAHPHGYFALDESFAELAGQDRGMLGSPLPNLVVIRSLTKTWAVPGARVGFAWASGQIAASLRAELSSWPLSCFGQAIAVRALSDRDFPAASASFVAEARESFMAGLARLERLRAYPGAANFLLLEFESPELGSLAATGLLRAGSPARSFCAAEGIDGRFLRVAVRRPEDNKRFLENLSRILGAG